MTKIHHVSRFLILLVAASSAVDASITPKPFVGNIQRATRGCIVAELGIELFGDTYGFAVVKPTVDMEISLYSDPAWSRIVIIVNELEPISNIRGDMVELETYGHFGSNPQEDGVFGVPKAIDIDPIVTYQGEVQTWRVFVADASNRWITGLLLRYRPSQHDAWIEPMRLLNGAPFYRSLPSGNPPADLAYDVETNSVFITDGISGSLFVMGEIFGWWPIAAVITGELDGPAGLAIDLGVGSEEDLFYICEPGSRRIRAFKRGDPSYILVDSFTFDDVVPLSVCDTEHMGLQVLCGPLSSEGLDCKVVTLDRDLNYTGEYGHFGTEDEPGSLYMPMVIGSRDGELGISEPFGDHTGLSFYRFVPSIDNIVAAPNPFVRDLEFIMMSYCISVSGKVEAVILSGAPPGGALVKTLHGFECKTFGDNVVAWNGRNNSGVPVNPGQYTLRLKLTENCASESVMETVAFPITVRVFDEDNSSIRMMHGSNPALPYPPAQFAQLGGCPANGFPALHPDGTSGPANADYWLEVTLRDTENAPIAGASQIRLDMSNCVMHENLPSFISVDAPTDANGVTRFLSGLRFGGADSCSFKLQVAGNDWRTYNGLRNVDITGDRCVTLADLYAWQAAFIAQPQGPVYKCDLDLNNYPGCTVTDLQRFQSHFSTSPHGDNCPSSILGELGVDIKVGTQPDNGAGIIGGNDLATLYFHVGERAVDDAPPPVIPPQDAVNAIEEVGPGGRDVTVWLFAAAFAEVQGVHLRFDLPIGWQLEAVEEVLDGQVFAHPTGYWPETAQFMTAFDCMSGGRPVAVGRFDVHVTEPGGIRISEANPIVRIGDCRERVTILEQERSPVIGRIVHGEKAESGGASVAAEVTLRRTTPVAGVGPAVFLLSLPTASTVSVRVYDMSGRLIQIVENQSSMPAGAHPVVWNGRSSRGAQAGTGVYALEVLVGDKRIVERIILLK